MNISQLSQDTHSLCGSTSGTYTPTNLIRNINVEYQSVARLIRESAGGWSYSDNNTTNSPTWTTTLTHGTQAYNIPSTIQKVQEVTVKDKSGNWIKLLPFDIHDTNLAPQEYYQSAGMPIYYDLVGTQIDLYPTPSSAYATLISGMCVFVEKDITEFATTATTTIPGFATPFHRILSLAAAIDYTQDINQKQFLAQQKARLEQGLTKFYSNRSVESRTAIKPRGQRNWRQYT